MRDSFDRVENAPLWKNWAPRGSGTYDLRGQGKTVLKLWAGKYSDQVGTGTPGPNPNGSVSQTYTWNDSNGDLIFQGATPCGTASDTWAVSSEPGT